MATTGRSSGEPGSLLDREHSIPWGRYEGTREARSPSHEILVAREKQRARFQSFLHGLGRRGVYLVTGHRGSGKTSFVEYCVREYGADVFSRFLRRDVARVWLWDRVGLIGLIGLVLTLGLLASELLQFFVHRVAARDHRAFDLVAIALLALLCVYPALGALQAARLFIESMAMPPVEPTKKPIGGRPRLAPIILALGGLASWAYGNAPAGLPESDAMTLVLRGGTFAFAAAALCTFFLPSLTFSSHQKPRDNHGFPPEQFRSPVTFLLLAIVAVLTWSRSCLASPTVALSHLLCAGGVLYLAACCVPTERRESGATALGWRFVPASCFAMTLAFLPWIQGSYQAVASSDRWLLLGCSTLVLVACYTLGQFVRCCFDSLDGRRTIALCASGLSVLSALLVLRVAIVGQRLPSTLAQELLLLAFIASLLWIAHSLRTGYSHRSYVLALLACCPAIALLPKIRQVVDPAVRTELLAFGIAPTVALASLACVRLWLDRKRTLRAAPVVRPHLTLVFKSVFLLTVAMQLVFPLFLLGSKGGVHAPAAGPPLWLWQARDRGAGLFTQLDDELCWLVAVVLCCLFIAFLEFEWIIRPMAPDRQDVALRAASTLPLTRPANRPLAHRLAAQTFFWRPFSIWLPVVTVPVKLGFDRLEHRRVVEAMLAGLRDAYHRQFLHWSSRFGLCTWLLSRGLLLCLALSVGGHWFAASPEQLDGLRKGELPKSPDVGQGYALAHAIAPVVGARVLAFDIIPFRWPEAREPRRALPGEPEQLSIEQYAKAMEITRWLFYTEARNDDTPASSTTLPTARRGSGSDEWSIDSGVRDAAVVRLHPPLRFRVHDVLVFGLFWCVFLIVRRAWPLFPYREIHRHVETTCHSLSGSLRHEVGGPLVTVKGGPFGLRSSTEREERLTQPVDPRAVDLVFLRILREIEQTKLALPFAEDRVSLPVPEIVFVFDELDKVGVATTETPTGDPHAAPEREPLDEERERSRRLHSLFADLKNILSSARARFVFIGDRNLHDEWLADRSSRRPLLTHIFDGELFLPSLLAEATQLPAEMDAWKPDPKKLTAGVELFLRQHLWRAGQLNEQWHRRMLLGLERRLPLDFVQVMRLKNDLTDGEQGAPGRTSSASAEVVEWSRTELWEDFVAFAAYRSLGNVKRLKQLLESQLRIVTAGPDEDPGWNHELHFTERDRYRVQLLAGVFRHIQATFRARTALQDDKLLTALLYLSDFLLKFHRRAFSWGNLERVGELVHIHRAPQLRGVLEQLVYSWGVHSIQNGTHDFRFQSDFRAELEYLSRTSDEELAALNFTVDDAQTLKRTYRSHLHDKQGDLGQEYASALGELHEFDEDYKQARTYYLRALDSLDARFAKQVGQREGEDGPTTALSVLEVLTEEPGLVAVRALTSWGIHRVRLMLQIGMTHERSRDYESALVQYRETRRLAETLVMALLGQDSDWGPPEDGFESKSPYFATVKQLSTLFQPLFAEAWLGEKLTTTIDMAPALLEVELSRLRHSLPFVKHQPLHRFEPALSARQVQHADFGLLMGDLHDKLGDLYFFKGRQAVERRHLSQVRDATRSTKRDSWSTYLKASAGHADGHLPMAEAHYGITLHEVQRFNRYRRASSVTTLNVWRGDMRTITKGDSADFVLRLSSGALADLADVLAARVSFTRLWRRVHGLAPEAIEAGDHATVKTSTEDASLAIRRWMVLPARDSREKDTEADADREWTDAYKALLPGARGRSLSDWLGKPTDSPETSGHLISAESIHEDHERLVASLLLRIGAAEFSRRTGLTESAVAELLRVADHVTQVLWWKLTVEKLSGSLAGAEHLDQRARDWLELPVTWESASPAELRLVQLLARIGLQALETAWAWSEEQGAARVQSDAGHLRSWRAPPQRFAVQGCSLGLALDHWIEERASGDASTSEGLKTVQAELLGHVAEVNEACGLATGNGSATSRGREAFRANARQHAARWAYPALERLRALKLLVDDAALLALRTGEKNDLNGLETDLADLGALEAEFEAPLQFPPPQLGASLTLSVAAARHVRMTSVSTEVRAGWATRAAERVQVGLDAFTMRRSYYQALSKLYYLYDDMNDRRIHFNLGMQMASAEVLAVLRSTAHALRQSPEPDEPRDPS